MEFDTDHCEVCHKPMTGGSVRASELPRGVRPEDVYVPSRDGEVTTVEIELEERDEMIAEDNG